MVALSPSLPLVPGRFPPPIMAPGSVHELGGGAEDGFAEAGLVGFVALLLAVVAPLGPVLWVAERSEIYPPGLMRLGLDPARIILAQAQDASARLATLEIGLRGGLHGVVVGSLNRIAARRLAFAARQGGGMGLVLSSSPAGRLSDSTACASRWRITPAPSRQPDTPRWNAELLYARNTPPAVFLLEADYHGSSPAFALVAGLADPAAIPVRRRQTG